MVSGMKYNKLIRRIHLLASVVMLIFALLYTLTGFIMSRNNWFPHGESRETVRTVPLNYSPDTSRLEQLEKNISRQFELSGRTENWRDSENRLRFQFYRPGVKHLVTLHQSLDSLTIVRTERLTIGEVSTSIHRIHGFGGGWKYAIWAILLDIAALAFIVFSISGVLIWFRSRKQLSAGWLFIIPATALTVAMIFFLS